MGGIKGNRTLRVACDLDGTVADMENALQREAERLFGPDIILRPAGSTHLEAPVDVDALADGASKVDVSAGTKTSGRRWRRSSPDRWRVWPS
jgi:hypothetical protein